MAITLTLGSKSTIHPGDQYRQALRLLTPTDFWGKANSYRCPLGMEAGVAYVLMLRRDLDELANNSLHELRWVDTGSATLTIPSLAIVRAECINRSRRDDKTAAYFVELRDKRHLLKMSSINAQYNVRVPAPQDTSSPGIYYSDSLNASSAWTWQTLLDDIWGDLPSTAGTAPTLPYSPDGTPENWRFIGVSAWEALHEVLGKIGCTTKYDPIANSFSYVRLGTTQANLAGALSVLETRIMFDRDFETGLNLADMPETIRVFFHRREQYHGIEKDTPESDNWEMTPVVSKDYSTGVSGALSGSVLAVWDDLPALHDSAGTNTNSTALQTRADEVGQNIANTIGTSREDFRRVYSGIATTVLPGSEVSEVVWRDYGDAWGLVTEIMLSPVSICNGVLSAINEKLAPPDFTRGSYPVYPRVCQPVKATATSPNGSGYYAGTVQRWIGSWEDLQSCWIKVADDGVSSLTSGDRYVGRLSGIDTDTGDTRPVYVVRVGDGGTHDVSADNGSTVTLDSGDTLDFDASDQSFATEANSTDSLKGIVNKVETDGGDSTIKRVSLAIDKSPLQNVVLSGSNTSGTTPVLVRKGTRNSITLVASSDSIITLAGGSGQITISTANPLFTVEDDESPTNSADVDYVDNVVFESTDTNFTVSKNLSEVTVSLGKALPIGSVIMSAKAPVLDGGEYYLDRDGNADTNWALMDGSANAQGGGSGITMATSSGTADEFFVRAKSGTSAPNDTAAGRTVNSGDVDNDEVQIDATVADHPDHLHEFSPTDCHVDPGGGAVHFDFATAGPIKTTIQKTSPSAGTLTLDHTVTIDLTNHQGTEGTGDDHIEMTPPHKKLYFFERIA